MLQQIALILGEIIFHVRLAPWFIGILFQYYVLQCWLKRDYRQVRLEANIRYTNDETRKRNVLDIYHYKGNISKQVIVFVHGGGWKSGDKLFYYHLAHDLCRTLKRTVVTVNYTLFPNGTIENQVTDVTNAIQFVKDHLRTNRLLLIGHSAGAHLVAYCLAMKYFGVVHSESMDRNEWDLGDIDGWIGLSGVYDIMDHYTIECRRGVVKWSGMEGAMHGVPYFAMHSPSWFFKYPGSFSGHNVSHSNGVSKLPFVNTLLLHGEEDETVPSSQSKDFYDALVEHFQLSEENKTRIQFESLPNINHSDIVMSLMEVASRKRHREVVIQQLERGIERFSTP